MDKIKAFLQTKAAKRAAWTVLNSVMAMFVSMLVYLAADNVAWAMTTLPIVQALAQLLTKYLNTK